MHTWDAAGCRQTDDQLQLYAHLSATSMHAPGLLRSQLRAVPMGTESSLCGW